MKGYSLRLFPTRSQEAKLWQSVGVARWVWNWGLNFNQDLYAKEKRILAEYALKKEFTKVRNSGEFPWLKEVSRQVANNALIDLGQAYKNFYRGLKKGQSVGLPRFKSRVKSTPSFCLNSDRVYDDGKGALQLEKIGHVRFKSDLDLTGVRLWNTRIKFLKGKWILSFALENESRKPKLSEYNMGIDVGVKSLAVVSCGGRKRRFKNINRSYKVRRLEKQLKHKQRALARKEKGSKNRKKALTAVQNIYGKLKNIRHDYTHKVTTKIVRMLPGVIVLEDLNVQGMMKNTHLAKKIAEQNFYKFRAFIEYKAKEYGVAVKLADRFYPSSKTCSCCGHVLKGLKLSDRVYKCPECGLELDRDFNAARNLEKLATRSPRGTLVPSGAV